MGEKDLPQALRDLIEKSGKVLTLETKETQAVAKVPFKPFTELPEWAVEAMKRGLFRDINAPFVFEGMRGRVHIWGGVSEEVNPELFEGDDPYPDWARRTVGYELDPQLQASIDVARNFMRRFSLVVRGVEIKPPQSLREGEDVFSQVTYEGLQDWLEEGWVALSGGSIPYSFEYGGFAPAVGVRPEKVRDVEAVWVPIEEARWMIPVKRRLLD